MSTLFINRMELGADADRHDVLLVFVSTASLDEADFSDKVISHVDRDLVPDEIMTIVREPHLSNVVEQFASSETLDALKKRIRNKAVISVRAFGSTGKESRKEVVHGSGSVAGTIETLVRKVITRLVKDRHGFVQAAGNYHFALPSQRHSQRFIRISNILVDAAEISFIAFGLLPYVKDDVRTMYVDTPALFPIVSALSDHLLAFYPTRAPIVMDNFRSYAGYQTCQFAVDPENRVLISASSSGRLAQAILNVAQFDSKQIVHLLFSGRGDGGWQVVCNIAQDEMNPNGFSAVPEDYRAGECPLCATRSVAVQLVGDHFELPGPRPVPLVLGISDINPRFPDLMRRLVGSQVLSVGFGRSNQATIARQFEVSPDRLIARLAEIRRLEYVLNHSVPATAQCIICLNEQSTSFAETVQKHIRVSGAKRVPPICMASDLGALDRTDSMDAILVVASVTESGRSLQDISRDLRRPFPGAPQIYLIGLAKYVSEAAFQRLKSNLTQTHAAIPHEFIAIERIQLPSSSEANAWIAERNLLSDPTFLRNILDDEKEDWERRLNRLRKQTEPLIDDLFVSAVRGIPIKLQPGFALWPEELAEKGSQADVFFTMATIFQSLRAKEEEGESGRALRTDLFQQTLIDPGNLGRFNDGIIQASLLRTAQPHELDYSTSPNDSRDMARYARRIVVSSQLPRGEAAAELLIALATKRLRLRPEHYEEVLEPSVGMPPRVEHLIRVVRDQLEQDGLLMPVSK